MTNDPLRALVLAGQTALREALPEAAGASASLVLAQLAAVSNPVLGVLVSHFTKALLSALLSKQDEVTLLLTAIARAPYRAALVELNEALSMSAKHHDQLDYRAKRCLQALGHLDLAAEQCTEEDRLIITLWKGLASLHIPGGQHAAVNNFTTFAAGSTLRADQLKLTSRENAARANLLDPLTKPPKRKRTPVEQLFTFSDGFSESAESQESRSIDRPQGVRFDTLLDERAQNRLRHNEAQSLRFKAEEDTLLADAYSEMAQHARAFALLAQSSGHA